MKIAFKIFNTFYNFKVMIFEYKNEFESFRSINESFNFFCSLHKFCLDIINKKNKC